MQPHRTNTSVLRRRKWTTRRCSLPHRARSFSPPDRGGYLQNNSSSRRSSRELHRASGAAGEARRGYMDAGRGRQVVLQLAVTFCVVGSLCSGPPARSQIKRTSTLREREGAQLGPKAKHGHVPLQRLPRLPAGSDPVLLAPSSGEVCSSRGGE